MAAAPEYPAIPPDGSGAPEPAPAASAARVAGSDHPTIEPDGAAGEPIGQNPRPDERSRQPAGQTAAPSHWDAEEALLTHQVGLPIIESDDRVGSFRAVAAEPDEPGASPADSPVGPSGPEDAGAASDESARGGNGADDRQIPVRSGRKVSTLLVGVLAGVLIGATAITSRGTDLRPEQTGDLAQLAAAQQKRNEALAASASALTEENDQLAAAQGATPLPPDESQQELGQIAGLAAVVGPAVQVRLTDAPADFAPPGVDGDLLVVHEQDIQQVVNALWAGGAEAMTIQGQRVMATTAVKCVGNTVVLQGVPYAPPYVITAIGDQDRLEAALAADPKVQIYRQYAQVYQLGYAEQRLDEAQMPAYTGPLPQQASVGGR